MSRSKGFRKTCLPTKKSRTEPTPSTDLDYHHLRANPLHVLLCTCKDKKTIFSEVTLLCSLNTGWEKADGGKQCFQATI